MAENPGERETAARLAALKSRAEAGDVPAQLALARSYLYGTAGKVDAEESLRWCRLALASGDPAGKALYGSYHYSGIGLPKDRAAAYRCWREAAEAGNPEGQALVAWALSQGMGVERDHKQAAAWWLKAAANGMASAQISLARCYERGWGVDKDLAAAAFWNLIAYRNGKTLAINEVDRLFDLLSPEQAERVVADTDTYIREHPECLRKRGGDELPFPP